MNNFIVYKHTCPNGKVYIGITSQALQKRFSGGKSGYRHNTHFTNAILKYGWENIKHEVLFENLSKEDACLKEIELIKLYKSNEKEYGYNNSIGGEHNKGFHLSEEAKKKVSIAQKGRKRTPEEIEKIRNKLKGRKFTQEQREKLKGRVPWNKGMSGNHHTEEWKEKRRKNMKPSNMGKKVMCVETGEIYKSMTEAIKSFNLRGGNLSRAIKLNQRFMGYHWALIEKGELKKC